MFEDQTRFLAGLVSLILRLALKVQVLVVLILATSEFSRL